MLIRDIALYSENHKKHINKLCEQYSELSNVTAGGIYSNHQALKVKSHNSKFITYLPSATDYLCYDAVSTA
jgi:hypothetical protein